jgi:hypothetical protein
VNSTMRSRNKSKAWSGFVIVDTCWLNSDMTVVLITSVVRPPVLAPRTLLVLSVLLLLVVPLANALLS